LQIDAAKGIFATNMYLPYYNLIKQDDSQFIIKDVKLISPNKTVDQK